MQNSTPVRAKLPLVAPGAPKRTRPCYYCRNTSATHPHAYATIRRRVVHIDEEGIATYHYVCWSCYGKIEVVDERDPEGSAAFDGARAFISSCIEAHLINPNPNQNN